MKLTAFRLYSDKWSATAVALVAAASSTVMAHPGHEHALTPPQHPLHMVIEPQHFTGWFGTACLAFVAVKIWKQWSRSSVAPAMVKTQSEPGERNS
jgi:hypothetical protein